MKITNKCQPGGGDLKNIQIPAAFFLPDVRLSANAFSHIYMT